MYVAGLNKTRENIVDNSLQAVFVIMLSSKMEKTSVTALNKSQENIVSNSLQAVFCYQVILYICNELGVMGSKVNLTQNMNRHNPMNV